MAQQQPQGAVPRHTGSPAERLARSYGEKAPHAALSGDGTAVPDGPTLEQHGGAQLGCSFLLRSSGDCSTGKARCRLGAQHNLIPFVPAQCSTAQPALLFPWKRSVMLSSKGAALAICAVTYSQTEDES